MLSPARWDIECWRNARFPDIVPQDCIFLTRENEAGEEATLDLTAQTALLQVRYYEGAAGSALIDITSASGSGDRIDIIDAEGGQLRILIAQATLEALPAANPGQPLAERKVAFAYDLKIGGLVYAYGQFIVHQGVTR